MKRLLFNLLAVLSLLWCLSTMVLWVLSYQMQYELGWYSPDNSRDLIVARGRVVYSECSSSSAAGGGFNPPYGWHIAASRPPRDLEQAYRVRQQHAGGFGFW